MQIGLRVLDGHPESFYWLSREQQLNTLALLQAERDRADPKKQRRGPVANKVTGSPEALRFWASQGFGE